MALALAIAAVAGICSHLVLSDLLEEERVTTSIQRLQFKNYANLLSIENSTYSVSSAKRSPTENTVKLALEAAAAEEAGVAENEETGYAPAPRTAEVSEEAYETAENTSGTVIVFQEKESKTKERSPWPLSTSLGVAAGLLFAAVWLSRQEAMGNATNMLLDEGLENMSVQDAEIVGETIRRGEFTIPELMKEAGTSKTSTWRTVKKLVEKELVKETEKTKAPSRGLGGRGKPSKVYKYVGPGQEEE